MEMQSLAERKRLGRRVEGIAAALLPYEADGRVSVEAFQRHLQFTHRAGLINAVNLDTGKKRQRNQLLARLVKAYLLKESLDRLWNYHYEGAHAAIPTG